MDKYLKGELSKDSVTIAYDNLITVRKTKRSQVSKSISKIQYIDPNVNMINLYQIKLEHLSKDLKELHHDLTSLCLTYNLWTDKVFETENDVVDDYQDQITLAIMDLKTKLSSINLNTSEGSDIKSAPKFLLPKMELPIFSGKPEDYQKFITTFDSMIDKYNLDEYEKFLYIQKQLTGNAKSLLNTMKLADMTYTKAKKLLNEAYCDKLEQQFAIIKKMSNIKLLNGDDPYNWICQSRTIKDQIDNLGITSDLIFQYFLWEGLNSKFKEQFIAITNEYRPSLKQILEHSFEANKRYASLELKHKAEAKATTDVKRVNQTVVLAAKVENKLMKDKPIFYNKLQCSLCVSDSPQTRVDHKLFQCKTYPEVNDKIKKLKQIKACLKCGYANHSTADCRYVFHQMCSFCSKLHSSFLCNKNEDRLKPDYTKFSPQKDNNLKESVKPKKYRSTTNQLVQFAVQNSSFDKIIVPTFSVDVVNNTGPNISIRGLFDTASQSSFVSKDLADELKSKIIDKNIFVTVYGFNEKKTYKTDLVELVIYIDKHPYTIRAITIPVIRTNISLPELCEIGKEFEQKSYILADPMLKTGKVSKIQLLLGMDNSSVLSYKSISYGGVEKKSTYLDSNLGIMLMGDVTHMLNNVPYLKVNECEDFEYKN